MIGILVILTVCLAAPSLSAPSDPVFTLTDQNFEQFLQDKAIMLVDFYAPWCSDCENLKPHFNKAAKDLAREKKFVLAKMDCFGEGRYTCGNRFGIHQWPTLKVFRYGNYAGDYQGPQDEGSIKSYVDEALNDQQQNDNRAPNGLWNQAQQQYGNGCSQGGWTFNQISPNACG